jgi:serine/threonine protein kinase
MPLADCSLSALTHTIRDLPLKERGPLVRHIVRQIAEGLQRLDKVGFVHNDLKPDNLLVKGSQILLTDFGTSQPKETIWNTVDIKGTLDYMPWEVFAGDDVLRKGHNLDSFALGLIWGQLSTVDWPDRSSWDGRHLPADSYEWNPLLFCLTEYWSDHHERLLGSGSDDPLPVHLEPVEEGLAAAQQTDPDLFPFVFERMLSPHAADRPSPSEILAELKRLDDGKMEGAQRLLERLIKDTGIADKRRRQRLALEEAQKDFKKRHQEGEDFTAPAPRSRYEDEDLIPTDDEGRPQQPARGDRVLCCPKCKASFLAPPATTDKKKKRKPVPPKPDRPLPKPPRLKLRMPGKRRRKKGGQPLPAPPAAATMDRMAFSTMESPYVFRGDRSQAPGGKGAQKKRKPLPKPPGAKGAGRKQPSRPLPLTPGERRRKKHGQPLPAPPAQATMQEMVFGTMDRPQVYGGDGNQTRDGESGTAKKHRQLPPPPPLEKGGRYTCRSCDGDLDLEALIAAADPSGAKRAEEEAATRKAASGKKRTTSHDLLGKGRKKPGG